MSPAYVRDGVTISESKARYLPGRVFRFLNAIAQRPVIFLQLMEKGFTEADFKEGKSALDRVTDLTYADKLPSTSSEYQQALVGLDSWDEEHFQRTKAALEKRYPDQYHFLFAGELKAEQGPAAIRAVETFLERVDILRTGKDSERAASRNKDEAAIDLLFKRGILDDEMIQQLQGWIKVCTSVPDVEGLMPSEKEKAQFVDALFDLDLWFSDWSTTARTAIKRRDYLISLGLAERRERNPEEE